MATTDPIEAAGRQRLQLEESVAGLRDRINQLSQAQGREERELVALDQRLRELEGRTITLGSKTESTIRQLEEFQTLRERIARLGASQDENKDLIESAMRQLRQDADAQREASQESARRIVAQEKGVDTLRDRLDVFDEGLRRLNTESGEISHSLAQVQNSQSTLGERISANVDGLRRASSSHSTLEHRVDAIEQQVQNNRERVEQSFQALRRVEETAEHWQDLQTAVESLRGRLDESLTMLDASKSLVANVQRGFESAEERIGSVERVAEQLRARDARRERDVASLGDQIESETSQATQEQARFVALQEQIRRRQIDALEQEIRELKSYLRMRADDQ